MSDIENKRILIRSPVLCIAVSPGYESHLSELTPGKCYNATKRSFTYRELMDSWDYFELAEFPFEMFPVTMFDMRHTRHVISKLKIAE